MWNASEIKGLTASWAGEGGRALCGACPVLAGSRIVDQRWVKGSTDLDRVKCGGARPGGAGNGTNSRTQRDNTVADSGQDEFHEGACPVLAGNGLYQLKDLQRGTIVNEIERAYNGFAQLTGEYQSHSGAVSPSTTPQVQYAYTNGSANHVRRTSMTYPGGEGLQYNYGGGSNADNALNRLHSLRRDGTTLAHYRYLGQERVVIADYSGEPEIELTYYASGQSGEAGDPYVGLDRGGCPGGAGNAAANRQWREYTVAGSGHDEYYEGACPGGTGDGLYQLKDLQRGTLNASKTGNSGTPAREEQWNHDTYTRYDETY